MLVLQAMGRKIGFIPAAARLADPKREMPLQIYMAESKVTVEELCDNVNDQLTRDGRCIIVVSEGFEVGELGETKDSFGHTQFSASKTTVAQHFFGDGAERTWAAGAGQGARTGHGHGPAHDGDLCRFRILDEAYKVGQKLPP